MTYKIALLHTKLFRFMYHTPPICNLLLQLYLYIYRCTSLMFCPLTSEYSDVNGFDLAVLFNGLWYPLICTSSKVIISERVTKLLIKKDRHLVKSSPFYQVSRLLSYGYIFPMFRMFSMIIAQYFSVLYSVVLFLY